MIRKLAEKIWIVYRSILFKRKRMPFSKKKAEMLARLNPGKEKKLLIDEYYISNITKILAFCVLGTFLVVAIFISNKTNRLIDEDYNIKRHEYEKCE